jgi:hypothetical protein
MTESMTIHDLNVDCAPFRPLTFPPLPPYRRGTWGATVNRKLSACLLCLGLAATTLASGAAAQQRPIMSARDVPDLVAKARAGDLGAAGRLDTWIRAARTGSPEALSAAADVLNNGIVANQQLIRDTERQAAAQGWNPRTGYVRSIASGAAHMTTAQAAEVLALTERGSSLDSAVTLSDYLSNPREPQIIVPSFGQPVIDPEDVADVIAMDSDPVTPTPSKQVCKQIDYADRLTQFTLIGMQICITWRYDGHQYVGGGTRTIDPYVSLLGTANSWRWVGTKLAERYYYNYKRIGARSGYHTKTIGHFERCPGQIVVNYCDDVRLPQITLDGHYNGTYSYIPVP